jgi:hypothetical protein
MNNNNFNEGVNPVQWNAILAEARVDDYLDPNRPDDTASLSTVFEYIYSNYSAWTELQVDPDPPDMVLHSNQFARYLIVNVLPVLNSIPAQIDTDLFGIVYEDRYDADNNNTLPLRLTPNIWTSIMEEYVEVGPQIDEDEEYIPTDTSTFFNLTPDVIADWMLNPEFVCMVGTALIECADACMKALASIQTTYRNRDDDGLDVIGKCSQSREAIWGVISRLNARIRDDRLPAFSYLFKLRSIPSATSTEPILGLPVSGPVFPEGYEEKRRIDQTTALSIVARESRRPSLSNQPTTPMAAAAAAAVAAAVARSFVEYQRDLADTPRCVVCFESMGGTRLIQPAGTQFDCTHTLCTQCSANLYEHEKNTCPSCRSKVVQREGGVSRTRQIGQFLFSLV